VVWRLDRKQSYHRSIALLRRAGHDHTQAAIVFPTRHAHGNAGRKQLDQADERVNGLSIQVRAGHLAQEPYNLGRRQRGTIRTV